MAPFPIFQPNASNTPPSNDTPVALKGKIGFTPASAWYKPALQKDGVAELGGTFQSAW